MSWNFATGALATAVDRLGLVYTGGYAYALGGVNGAGTTIATVQKSVVSDDDGDPGSFAADTALPAARRDGAACVVTRSADGKDYILYLGGRDSGGAEVSTVYYTTQGSSGTLAAWTTAGGSAALPAVRADAVVVVYKETIFIIGGSSGGVIGTVIYNTIDGIIAGTAWTNSTALPAVRRRASGAIDSRVILLAGGEDGVSVALATVYAGVINDSSSTIAITWTATTSLPKVTVDGCSVAYDHHFYSIFGHDGTNAGTVGTEYTDVYRAPVLSSGILGDWGKVSAFDTSVLGTLCPADGACLMTGGARNTMIYAGGRIPSVANSATNGVYTEDTPTFWKLAARSDIPVGIVRKIHLYYDGSTQYRWADKAFNDSTGFDHDIIIKDIGTIQRGLGMDHFPQAADVQVTLNNDEQLADWLVNQATAANVMKATARIFIGAYSLAAGQYFEELVAWQQLGEYYISTNPVRTESEVSFGLTENTRGILVDISQTPTVRDWRDSGTSPLTTAQTWGQVPIDDEILDRAMPLVFGQEEAFCKKVRYGIANYTSLNKADHGMLWVVCCSQNATVDTISNFYVEATSTSGSGAVAIRANIPRNFGADTPGVFSSEIWAPKVSGPFTKYGKSWYVHYIEINPAQLIYFMAPSYNTGAPSPTYQEEDEAIANRLLRASVVGGPFSSMASTNNAKVTPEQVIRDIVGFYSSAGLSYLNETSLRRAETALHKDASAAGSVGDQEEVRTVFGELMASWDTDAFADYTGRFSITGGFRDYQSQLVDPNFLFELEETDLGGVSDRHPSRGQRWAVANRIFYDGLKDSLVAAPVSPGPWNNDSTILGTGATKRLVELRVSVAWRRLADAGIDPWTARGIDATARPVISFTTTLAMLRVDLGDYFKLSWTRNQSSPYSSALFKVEQMSIDVWGDSVTVEAVWVADLTTSKPFLLDLKANLTRVENNGTVTVQDTVATMDFSTAGILTTFGVAVGDQIILKDSTESATGFKRNRVLNISQVNTAVRLTVSDADLDFGSGPPLAVSEWEIRRSKLTQPSTAFPDYPSPGADAFGKISNTSSPPTYSDASNGHVLLEG